jgi:hypothetical protein
MPVVARRILITLVVLLVLLVLADRVGAYIAEKAAGDALQKSQNLDSKPEVDIAGFPFLTQLAAGDFDKISITAKDVPVGPGDTALPITHLDVVLHGVTVSNNFSTFRASRADATARIDYADLSRALHSTVTYIGNGRIRARASVSALGRTVSGSITAKPELHDRSLGFGSTQIDGAGGLAAQVTQELGKVFSVDLPLTNIPFSVQVTSLQATKQGILLQLAGRDITYTRH